MFHVGICKCGEWGNTPLHSAAALYDVSDAQQMALIGILLDYGADPMQPNDAQQLPFELVPPHRHQVYFPFPADSIQFLIINQFLE